MSLLTSTGTGDDTDTELLAAPVTAALRLPCVNLLPPEIAERERFRRVQLGLGAGLLAVAGAVAALQLAATGSVQDAEQSLQTAVGRGAELSASSAQFADVQDVHDTADAARAVLVQAMGDEVRFSAFLDDLSQTVPRNVWLKDVSFTQAPPTGQAAPTAPAGTGEAAGIGTVTFTGVAFEHDDVAAWLESLAEQKGYADPYFTESTTGLIGSRRTVSFTSTVTLTAEALSRRWTPDGS